MSLLAASKIPVWIEDSIVASRAQVFAQQYQLPIVESPGEGVYLAFTQTGIRLVVGSGKSSQEVQASFVDGKADHRRKFGGGKGQSIAKAVGLSRGFCPHVLDATAGLGKDAFVLASLGATVTLIERSPIAHLLLEDGLARAQRTATDILDVALLEILQRMTLHQYDSCGYMDSHEDVFDVVYLDPMFPERKKSALVKKEMRIFHEVIGTDEDASALLPLALDRARYRVVVKRPKLAPFLDNRKPSYQLLGKSGRYDIYTNKALPNG